MTSRLSPLLLALVLGTAPAQIPAQHGGRDHASAPETARGTDDAALRARQLAELRRSIAKYETLDVAKRDGFRLFGRFENALMGEHWYHPSLVNAPLDLARPSVLQYATVEGKRKLVGVAYTLIQPTGSPLPEGFAGDADVWHVHDPASILDAATAERPALRRRAEERRAREEARGQRFGDLVMLHVWTGLENPEGIFAFHHRAMPYVTLGLPAAWATAANGSMDAARGVALAAAGECEADVGMKFWLGGISSSQQERLEGACATQARALKDALARRPAAADFNALAARLWRDYEAVVDRTLTAEQKRRMATVTVHPAKGASPGGHAH